MDRISISQTRLSLFLISLTFLAIWILFICSFITWDFPLINLFLLYLFSLFLPAVGLLVFMKNIRKTSSRWYWGVPLLIGLILNTFVRDVRFMLPKSVIEKGFWAFFYGQSFITNFPIFLKWHIIEPVPYGEGYQMNFIIMNFISIFFSLAAALFCLSVPEEKRKKMMLPLGLSLIAAFSNLIYFIVESMKTVIINSSFSTYSFVSDSSFVISSIATLILGLSFVRVASIYDK